MVCISPWPHFFFFAVEFCLFQTNCDLWHAKHVPLSWSMMMPYIQQAGISLVFTFYDFTWPCIGASTANVRIYPDHGQDLDGLVPTAISDMGAGDRLLQCPSHRPWHYWVPKKAFWWALIILHLHSPLLLLLHIHSFTLLVMSCRMDCWEQDDEHPGSLFHELIVLPTLMPYLACPEYLRRSGKGPVIYP